MEAYLYLPYSEKVLGSDKSVVNSDNFARQELLRGAGNGYGDEAEPEPSGLQDMQEAVSYTHLASSWSSRRTWYLRKNIP